MTRGPLATVLLSAGFSLFIFIGSLSARPAELRSAINVAPSNIVRIALALNVTPADHVRSLGAE